MYEWLNSYQELKQKIEHLAWELERYKNELERWCDVDDLGKIRLVKESRASGLEEIIQATENELVSTQKDLEKLEKVVEGFQGLDQEILREKYIHGKSLKEIAIEKGYSYIHIKQKHAKLLNSIPRVYRAP